MIVYIGIGSNLGDPVAQITSAIKALQEKEDIQILRCSSLYRTKPQNVTEEQPDFINAALMANTDLPADRLLCRLHEIEADFGRLRHKQKKNAPRKLDLDLLLYADTVLNTNEICVPHPRLHLRAFTVVPLLEITPDLEVHNRGKLAAWLPAVSYQGIEHLNDQVELAPSCL